MATKQEMDAAARAIRFVSHGVPLDKEIQGTTWVLQAEAALSAAEEAKMADESGWVIERGDSEVSAPLYFAPQTNDGWDKRHEMACRFARKQDAEAVAAAYGLADEHGVRVCEHSWV